MLPRVGQRPARGWLGYLVVGLVVVAAYYTVTPSGAGRVIRVVLYCAVSLSAAFAVGYGVRRNRPAPQASWLLLGLAQLVYATGDTVFYVSHYLVGSTAYPS